MIKIIFKTALIFLSLNTLFAQSINTNLSNNNLFNGEFYFVVNPNIFSRIILL